eukprot:snap_masked-scaffold_15-processed-gene-7.35-mRNA-1 protein AED:1.00 eAED:1.00 QI:0/-1/0/0/-1/1/1/0/542
MAAQVVLIVSCIYICCTFSVFCVWSFMNINTRISKRRLALITSSVMSIAFPVFLLLREARTDGRERFNCFLLMAILIYAPILFFAPYCVRVMLLYFNLLRSKELAKNLYERSLWRAQQTQVQFNLVSSNVKRDKYKNKRKKSWKADEKKGTILEYSFPNIHEEVPIAREKPELSKKYVMYKYCSTTFFGLLFLLLIIAVVSFLGWTLLNGHRLTPRELLLCTGCIKPSHTHLYLLLVVTASTLYCEFFFKLTRNEPDTFSIRSEIITAKRLSAVAFLVYLALDYFKPKDLERKGWLSWSYLSLLTWLLAYTISVPVQFKQAMKDKDRSSVFESHLNVKLNNVLRSQVGRELFKTHLVHEMSLENYMFCLEVTSWRMCWGESCCETHRSKIETEIKNSSPRLESEVSIDYMFRHTNQCESRVRKHRRSSYFASLKGFHLDGDDGKEEEERKRETAETIYDFYIKPGALLQVNIGFEMREKIKDKLLNREEYLDDDVFDEAFKEVFGLMSNDSFPRFLNSKEYKQYIGAEIMSESRMTSEHSSV